MEETIIDYGSYYYKNCSHCGEWGRVYKTDNPKGLCSPCSEWDAELSDLQSRLTAETKRADEAGAKLHEIEIEVKHQSGGVLGNIAFRVNVESIINGDDEE